MIIQMYLDILKDFYMVIILILGCFWERTSDFDIKRKGIDIERYMCTCYNCDSYSYNGNCQKIHFCFKNQ